MSTERTENLIAELTESFEGAKPLAHPLKRLAPWLIVAALYVSAVVYFVGLRPDIHAKFLESDFVFEMSLLLLMSLSAAITASWLSVPDARGAGWMAAVPLTSAGLYFLWIGARLLTGEKAHIPHIHWDVCITEGFLMIIVPVAALIYVARGGNTTRPLLMSAMNMLAVGSLGYLGLRLTCTMDTIGHTMCFHCVPFIALGIIAGFFARKIYKW